MGLNLVIIVDLEHGQYRGHRGDALSVLAVRIPAEVARLTLQPEEVLFNSVLDIDDIVSIAILAGVGRDHVVYVRLRVEFGSVSQLGLLVSLSALSSALLNLRFEQVSSILEWFELQIEFFHVETEGIDRETSVDLFGLVWRLLSRSSFHWRTAFRQIYALAVH